MSSGHIVPLLLLTFLIKTDYRIICCKRYVVLAISSSLT